MTTQTAEVLPDLRPALGAAMDQIERLLEATPAGIGTRPTPCAEFDVSQLVGHLQGVVRRVGVVMAGRPFESAPTHVDSVEWLADWRAGRAETEAVLADDAALEREVSVPWGRVPGAAALGGYVGELTVHAWDLARTIGREDLLVDELAEASLPPYRQVLPADARGGAIPFGPVVPVSDDAGAYARLVAWTGRDPGWSVNQG